MKISKKSDALKLVGAGSKQFKFCSGKYKWTGSVQDWIGKDVQDIDGVVAVYAERRQDRYGAYTQLMSVSKN